MKRLILAVLIACGTTSLSAHTVDECTKHFVKTNPTLGEACGEAARINSAEYRKCAKIHKQNIIQYLRKCQVHHPWHINDMKMYFEMNRHKYEYRIPKK